MLWGYSIWGWRPSYSHGSTAKGNGGSRPPKKKSTAFTASALLTTAWCSARYSYNTSLSIDRPLSGCGCCSICPCAWQRPAATVDAGLLWRQRNGTWQLSANLTTMRPASEVIITSQTAVCTSNRVTGRPWVTLQTRTVSSRDPNRPSINQSNNQASKLVNKCVSEYSLTFHLVYNIAMPHAAPWPKRQRIVYLHSLTAERV